MSGQLTDRKVKKKADAGAVLHRQSVMRSATAGGMRDAR
jgi:hypothetical protein